MVLTGKFREVLTNEIEYVLEKMSKEDALEKKLFYFSAVHGTINRIFNLNFDEDLVYISYILSETHSAFARRLTENKKGNVVICLTAEHMKSLENLLRELKENIIKKGDIDNTMKKFVLLAYSTAGNGYYLFQKGLLKI